MLEFAQFLGPVGGLLCIAWAMGAIAGYVFHSKTVAAVQEAHLKEQLKELRKEHADLLIKAAELTIEARYIGKGHIKYLHDGEVTDVE